MSQWVRLWEDMPNDPKWRVVARRAGRPVSEVLAVFIHMMTNAGASGNRGSMASWSDEDVAIAIDAEPEHVTAIREAMQGKTLDGEHLTGWERRQPKREDSSTERVRELRERERAERNALEHSETQCNACETTRNAPEEKREDKSREEKKERSSLCSDSAREAFQEFKFAYPKRTGSQPWMPAEKKFLEHVKRGVDPAEIITGARAYAGSPAASDPQFVAQAVTWLNQARWKDEYHPADSSTGPPSKSKQDLRLAGEAW